MLAAALQDKPNTKASWIHFEFVIVEDDSLASFARRFGGEVHTQEYRVGIAASIR